MHRTPYKRPIRHLQNHLIKYTNDNYSKELARNFPHIHRWNNNNRIDSIKSNDFWNNS